jgi:exodeoxyribonuclease V beta subunit
VAAIHSEQLEGFLKGFVDLIVRHDGRFYLIDYKSNWLGDRFANYEASALASAMTGGGYTLQYLIYTVALVRWLRFRDADFDYERDVGGVCYLFLRGIAPGKKDAEGRPCGVFFARPQKSLIDELDRTFEGHRR